LYDTYNQLQEADNDHDSGHPAHAGGKASDNPVLFLGKFIAAAWQGRAAFYTFAGVFSVAGSALRACFHGGFVLMGLVLVAD
jgi:hypothetical protein